MSLQAIYFGSNAVDLRAQADSRFICHPRVYSSAAPWDKRPSSDTATGASCVPDQVHAT
jgi:hypothetical protein